MAEAAPDSPPPVSPDETETEQLTGELVGAAAEPPAAEQQQEAFEQYAALHKRKELERERAELEAELAAAHASVEESRNSGVYKAKVKQIPCQDKHFARFHSPISLQARRRQ